MTVEMVAGVRRFNRVVTQRIGALNDSFLASDRPLSQNRVLWEIGADACDVRSLRRRLGLDSGYLSRLLRALEAEKLIAVASSQHDGRIRIVRLTAAGRREVATLDQRSDDAASAILQPLSDRQRGTLIKAMADVERLLVASMVDIGVRDPADDGARFCLGSYFAELGARFSDGFDPAVNPLDDAEMRPPAGLLLVATLQGEPVGCGALTFLPGCIGLVKRMWVSQKVRGSGLGRRLLEELEQRARAGGMERLQLDTQKDLAEAISLYRSSGYLEVPRFNDNPYADLWFEKPLT